MDSNPSWKDHDAKSILSKEMQLMTSILGRYFSRFLTMAYLLVAVIPLVTGTAQAQLEQETYIKASNSGEN
jgi:hypothetical protein